MNVYKQTLNNSISVPKGKIHQYSIISHIQSKIELLIDNYQKSLKSLFLIKITHNQINSCVHWQSNSLLIFTGLGDYNGYQKELNTALVSLLVWDLLNHLNPVLVPRSVTYLPAFSHFPPLQPLRIQFCFPQRQTDENTN